MKIMATTLNCSWIGAIPVNSVKSYSLNDCHNNVKKYISKFKGTAIIGYSFYVGFGTIQAVRHSIVDNQCITPYSDNRKHIIFAIAKNQDEDYSISNCYEWSLDKYIKQETTIMYYVYKLINPLNGQPFYIGKGSGERAQSHLNPVPNTRNAYKENIIANIRKTGKEPIIEYVAENIIDEDLAYTIEDALIEQYGRKGYDKNGMLSNICKGNRPPNHKGKTYDEIYGTMKAKEQRELRSRLQLARGGYGPDIQTDETRNKISNSLIEYYKTHKKAPMSDEQKALISSKAKLRVGKLNKRSLGYVLTGPNGNKLELWGGELAKYCIENNLSYSTLKKQIQKTKSAIPKYGKTAGWKLEKL